MTYAAFSAYGRRLLTGLTLGKKGHFLPPTHTWTHIKGRGPPDSSNCVWKCCFILTSEFHQFHPVTYRFA